MAAESRRALVRNLIVERERTGETWRFAAKRRIRRSRPACYICRRQRGLSRPRPPSKPRPLLLEFRLDTSLVIHRVPLGALVPDPANPRRHDDANLAAIRASLSRFRQAEAVVTQTGGRRIKIV